MNTELNQRLQAAECLCAERGARLTTQRKAVLALIYRHGDPISAYELLRQLKESHPKAEAMTVYRALEFLQQQQLIHRIASQNAFTACDTPSQHHHAQLLLCERCGQSQEVCDDAVERALQNLADRYGFALTSKPREISGICQSCV